MRKRLPRCAWGEGGGSGRCVPSRARFGREVTHHVVVRTPLSGQSLIAGPSTTAETESFAKCTQNLVRAYVLYSKIHI